MSNISEYIAYDEAPPEDGGDDRSAVCSYLPPGLTFYELYVRGELPWPRESLFSGEDGQVAVEYVRLLDEVRHARAQADDRTVRRLRSEIEDARYVLDRLDAYGAAEALGVVRDHLDAQVAAILESDIAPVDLAIAADPPPEDGRFGGPAPFYLRGRAYARTVTTSLEMAPYRNGSTHDHDQADQLLRVVEMTSDPVALQDFIAGVAREFEAQFRLAQVRPR